MRASTSYLLLAILLFLCACGSIRTSTSVANTRDYRLPKYSILIQDSVHHAAEVSELPRRIYLFPPLLVDGNFKPLGKLIPRTEPEGKLSWSSDAPASWVIGEELSDALESKGHHVISFDSLSRLKSDHAVTVLNLYFSEPVAEKREETPTGRRLARLRIIASTYPASLDPTGKRDLLQADALVVFEDERQYELAVRRGFRSLAGRLQTTGAQTRVLSLLN